MIHESVLEAVGRTPVVRLSRLTADVDRQVFVKLENLNPGGSHKVRIALNMIRDAEGSGVLVPGAGQTVIEPTGGNTGLGLAMAAAVLGYRLVLVIPDNYSPRKRQLLELFGAEVVLSDSSRGGNSHGELASELLLDHPDWLMLNQQANPANPAAHRQSTGPELLAEFSGQTIDAFVAGVGTGGHLTGVGQVLKEAYPDLSIWAVQPEGCSLLDGRFVNHDIQGLAVGIVPAVLDLSLIDETVSVSYGDAMAMMVRLMRTEGLAVGISSAANVVAALEVAEQFPPGASVVTLAYDNAADYVDALSDWADLERSWSMPSQQPIER